jgi:hypothetical protein
MAQNRNWWKALVNAVKRKKTQGPENAKEFLDCLSKH